MKQHYCIINTENKQITDTILKYGYEVIATELSNNVSIPISLHADVLYLKVAENDIFVSDCQQHNIKTLENLGYNVNQIKLKPGYKTESKLNMVVTDKILLCNNKTCMDISKISNGRSIINTNQGYTKCSTIVLSEDNFITEDIGIYTVLKKAGKNCVLIDKGFVRLNGYDYGFIGGASAYLKKENVLFFFGDITKHKNYNTIYEFCKKLKIHIDFISDCELIDIGGAIIL